MDQRHRAILNAIGQIFKQSEGANTDMTVNMQDTGTQTDIRYYKQTFNKFNRV